MAKTKTPKSKPSAPGRPSGIRNQQPPAGSGGKMTLLDHIRGYLALPDGTPLGASHVEAIMRIGGVVPTSNADELASGLAAALKRKKPEEWRAALRLGDAAEATATTAAPSRPKPESAKPAAGTSQQGSAAQMRQFLLDNGMKEEFVSGLSDEDVRFQATELRKAQEKAELASASRSEKQTKREQAREQTLARSRKRNQQGEQPKGPRRGRRRAAAAVTTEGEAPQNNLSEDTVSGGAADLGELPSEQLYDMARKAQIREGMTFGDTAGIALNGETIDTSRLLGGDATSSGDVVSVDKFGTQAGGSVQPQPQPQGVAPAQRPVTQQADPEPPREPFFRFPANPFGTWVDSKGVTQDRWARSALRNSPKYVTYGGIGVGSVIAGLKGLGALRGGSQPTEQQMQDALSKAVEARARVRQQLGDTQDAIPITVPSAIPADKQLPPAGTILRELRGAK